MRMYSWASWEGVGEGLVDPNWLAWAPDGSALALGYADALLLCRTQPAFGAIASLPLQVGCCPACVCMPCSALPQRLQASQAASFDSQPEAQQSHSLCPKRCAKLSGM
jgi:hypothetical protein